MCAAGGGHTEIVALLLDRGAEVNKTNRVSFAEYISSIMDGPILFHKDFLIPFPSYRVLHFHQIHVTPLMKAALNGHVDIIQLLINHGCDEELVNMVRRRILCFV